MEFTAQQIADFLQGDLYGDASVKVSDFSKIEEGKKGTLSFLSNPKYNHYIYESEASLILVNRDFEPDSDVKATLIKVDNAYEALAKLLTFVERLQDRRTGVSELASIAPSAKIGENVYIAPFVVVDENTEIGNNVVISSHCSIGEGVKIGSGVRLHTGVKICSKCVIGDDCTFHAGVVIGSDGFGFAPTGDGSYRKIPQTGNVIIESNVEIGANSTVDRATLGSTIIRKGVKIDNLVQIAHNVEIGENTVIASQSGVAGSTKVGKNCVFAGQVGIAGHLHIADGSIFGAKTGVPNSIKQPNMAYQGYPAIPVAIFRRSSVVYKNLPELQKIIYDLQRKINELEEKVNRDA